MRAFYVMFGILSFIVGILCLINPFSSFLAIGIIVAVFLLLVGIYFIMSFFMNRSNPVYAMNKPAIGVAGLLLGIAMVVIAILSLAVPNIEDALDMVILILFAVWMIFNGIMAIFNGVTLGRQSQPGGPIMIVVGVIITAAGAYGLVHMVLFSETLGLMLGILLLIYGMDLIFSAFADPGTNM